MTRDHLHGYIIQLVEKVMDEFEYVPRPRRVRNRTSRLTDSVVAETIGEGDIDVRFKPIYFEIIDSICNELKRRFHHNSDILYELSDLQQLDSNIDIKSLEPLAKIGLVVPSQTELSLVANYLKTMKEDPENAGKSNLKILAPLKAGMKNTFALLEACETFGSSILLKRMSMTSQRLCDLAFIAFEKQR